MSKYIPILILAAMLIVRAAGQSWSVTNFNGAIDTNWQSNVIPKLNSNYNNIVFALNQQIASNALLSSEVSNLNGLLTNGTYLGAIYASNSWSLAAVTSAMPNFSFRLANSNGAAFVLVYSSNGVAFVRQQFP